MTEQQRLALVDRVTANYFFWQGLRWVPLGLALLIVSVVPFPGDRLLVTLLLVGSALFLSTALGRYYSRRFGRIRRYPSRYENRERWKWFVVYPLMFLSLLWDARFPSLFFVSGPIWGAAIVAYWWSTGRGRLHYVPIAVVVCLSGFLPATGFVSPGKAMFDVFFGIIGATYVVGGILDHFALVRVLTPMSAPHDGRAV